MSVLETEEVLNLARVVWNYHLLHHELKKSDCILVLGSNDPRVADIPIIMITSRVGDKHRARAIELGVNDYLGKPYQDSQLLDAIRRQLEEKGIELP